MRILYVTDQVYLHGGAEKILIQKLNYWADVFGYETMLVTTNQKGLKPFAQLSEKVRLHDLGIPYTEGTFYSKANLGLVRKHFGALKKAISDFDPAAVFVISQTLPRFITPFASGDRPCFYEHHTSYYGYRLGRARLSGLAKAKAALMNLLVNFAESRYTKIVYLNQSEFEHYKRKNSVVIPNFFDAGAPAPDRPRKNVAIALGRMYYQKGYSELMDAWKSIDNKITGWSLEIYGNGEDAQTLLKKANSMSLRNPIKVKPAIPNVDEKLAESALYVLSSMVETFPMVLLESLSNKLPVVAFDCPTGPRHILTDGQDSLLVPPGNFGELADKILYLIQNENLRKEMGEKGYLNVQRFAPDAVMPVWKNLVKENRIK